MQSLSSQIRHVWYYSLHLPETRRRVDLTAFSLNFVRGVALDSFQYPICRLALSFPSWQQNSSVYGSVRKRPTRTEHVRGPTICHSIDAIKTDITESESAYIQVGHHREIQNLSFIGDASARHKPIISCSRTCVLDFSPPICLCPVSNVSLDT